MTQSLATLATDIQALQSIMANDCRVPDGIDVYELCLALLENFHSTDPVLRDEVSYSLLAGLIYHHQQLPGPLMRQFLEVALDDAHLFYGIGERGTDSVFMRGFSVLTVPLVLDRDASDRVLPPDLVHATTARMLAYARAERDFRGYVEGKGWAHTMAHSSDALDSCTQHPVTTPEEHRAIMDCIAELATVAEPMHWAEDDRLAFATHRIVLNGLVDEAYLAGWLQNFVPVETRELAEEMRHINGEHFLRSLYFIIQWKQPDHPLLDKISARMREISLFTKYGMLD